MNKATVLLLLAIACASSTPSAPRTVVETVTVTKVPELDACSDLVNLVPDLQFEATEAARVLNDPEVYAISREVYGGEYRQRVEDLAFRVGSLAGQCFDQIESAEGLP